MIAVLIIIVLFCCFAAPGIRGLCKRYIFRTCDIDDPDVDNASRITEEATPTVIVLPNGRMLLVDRRLLMRSDGSLGPYRGSTPSILDSSETSKGVSPTSMGYPPPNYEDVFPHLLDLPPSYSEISLLAKNCEAVNVTASSGRGEAVNVTASSGRGEADNLTASSGRGEDVNVTASSGRGEAGNVTASSGRGEAVNLTVSPSSGSGEAVGETAADVRFEAIEMVGLNRSGEADSGGGCTVDASSEPNTVILVESNVNRTNHDF